MKVRGRWRGYALWALLLALGPGLGACGETDSFPPDAADADAVDTAPDLPPDLDEELPQEVVDTGPDVPDIPPEPVFAWSEVSLGDLLEIGSVVTVSPREAYATSASRVLRFDGHSWAAFGEPSGLPVHGVTAVGGDVVVVGEGGLIARRKAGEAVWTLEDSGVDVALRAITHQESGELIAVGDSSTILHYGPEAGWTVSLSGGSVALRSVWAPSQGTGGEGGLAVGDKGTLYRHAGDLWVSEQIAAGDVTLHAVLGAGELRVAVGTGGTISVKTDDNAPWQGATSNLTDPRTLRALAALGAQDIRAFGDHGSIVAFDGDKWSVESVVGPHHVTSDLKAATAATDEETGETLWMALAASGGGLVSHEGTWLDLSTRPDAGIRDLGGASRDALWACGPDGLLMTTTSQGWTAVDTGTDADLNSLWVTASGDVYVVGAAATLLHLTPDHTLSALSVPAATDLLSVAVQGTDIVLGGKGGTVIRGDLATGEYNFWNAGMSWDVNAVTVDAEGAWWLAGGFGSLRRSTDGEETTAVSVPVSGTLQDMAPSGDGVIVVGNNGAVLHATADGGELVVVEQPATFLYGVHVRDGETWAVGYPGVALRVDSQGWSETDTGSKTWLEAIWSDEEGAIAAGRSGSLLQWSEVP
jgi:hypothetical protein